MASHTADPSSPFSHTCSCLPCPPPRAVSLGLSLFHMALSVFSAQRNIIALGLGWHKSRKINSAGVYLVYLVGPTSCLPWSCLEGSPIPCWTPAGLSRSLCEHLRWGVVVGVSSS